MFRKILYVFTKEYRYETKYREFLYRMRECVKLKTDSESVDEMVRRLSDQGFVSNCRIFVGHY